jgi:hypothetical protein
VILVDSSRLLFSLFGCRVSAEVGFDPWPEVRDRHHQDQAHPRWPVRDRLRCV